MEIESVRDPNHEIYVRDSAERPAGLHASDVVSRRVRKLYPRWFKEYGDERTKTAIRHFEKGWIVEEAFSRALGRMLAFFEKPEPRYIHMSNGGYWDEATARVKLQELPHYKGIWMSPDGYADGQNSSTTADWPDTYPSLELPAIFECKAGLKSCNADTSPITHEKFSYWVEQIMLYCIGWNTQRAYLMAHHFMGDYKERPYAPILMVHKFTFSRAELDEFWDEVRDEVEKWEDK